MGQQQQQQQLQQQQLLHHHNQLPLTKEIDDEGRICSVVLPETQAPPFIEENNSELVEDSKPIVKTEAEVEEEFASFIESAHDIFLKISSKEMTIKTAAEKLDRPYAFVYSRYQE